MQYCENNNKDIEICKKCPKFEGHKKCLEIDKYLSALDDDEIIPNGCS